MRQYEFLAGSYDALTTDVDYPLWADDLERQFRRAAIPVHTVLDLACGTGSLTGELMRRGYEMIGVDGAAEMLMRAAEKCRALPGQPPLFLQQRMEQLDLYGTVDACVCCLDSVNYLTRPALLARAFERVRLFLNPGGLFLFDARTPRALRDMDGQVFLDETRGTLCVWRAACPPRSRLCRYDMTIFHRCPDRPDAWLRGDETHREYVYSPGQLLEMLCNAGFQSAHRRVPDLPPHQRAGRMFFSARKPAV